MNNKEFRVKQVQDYFRGFKKADDNECSNALKHAQEIYLNACSDSQNWEGDAL